MITLCKLSKLSYLYLEKKIQTIIMMSYNFCEQKKNKIKNLDSFNLIDVLSILNIILFHKYKNKNSMFITKLQYTIK